MKKVGILGILILVGIIGFFVWWLRGNSPVNKKDTAEKVFVVEDGEAIRSVGNNLKEEGLINDAIVFFLYVKQNNLDKKIQAGDYKLSPSMSLKEIMEQLVSGRVDVWVLYKEGLRSEQLGEILQEEGLVNYDEETWLPVLKENEGYLFPDKYLIPATADVQTVVSIMRNNFDTRTSDAGITVTPQIVTLASLIERESRGDAEKPIIAGILTNRLNDDMGLEVDATLQYIVDPKDGKWWLSPTGKEKTIDSPYNTYKYRGLPPGPIANPGIESIKAAANPASTPYYYYIHEPDGTVHYARTLSEHNNNVNKYLR